MLNYGQSFHSIVRNPSFISHNYAYWPWPHSITILISINTYLNQPLEFWNCLFYFVLGVINQRIIVYYHVVFYHFSIHVGCFFYYFSIYVYHILHVYSFVALYIIIIVINTYVISDDQCNVWISLTLLYMSLDIGRRHNVYEKDNNYYKGEVWCSYVQRRSNLCQRHRTWTSMVNQFKKKHLKYAKCTCITKF